MPQGAIDLASGTGTDAIVTTSAGEHFWVDSVTVIVDTPGEVALNSGATTIAGPWVAVAGTPYSFFDLRSAAAGDDFTIVRTDAMAVGGSYSVRVK